MFIVSLTYIKPLEEVDALLEERHISPIAVRFREFSRIRA